MRWLTGVTFGAIALAFFIGVFKDRRQLGGEIILPQFSVIEASGITPVWMVIDRTPEDYVLYWEIHRADGTPAFDDFASAAGTMWLPKGGGIVNLRLEMTARARGQTFSGERYQLKVREISGRLESLSTVIVNLKPTESARL